jgi:hypothetical protein
MIKEGVVLILFSLFFFAVANQVLGLEKDINIYPEPKQNGLLLDNDSSGGNQELEIGIPEQEEITTEERYLELIKSSIEKYKEIYPLEPLFVLSIIKAESNFGKYEISSSGAAGPVQLMPLTAREMGMKVFFPYYYQIAMDERKMAAEYYRKAETAASKISFKNFLEENERLSFQVKLYREIGSWHEDQANSLFQRYKEELLFMVNGKTDEELMDIDQRFIVSLVIDACVRILANNARKINGDEREIASSYNAGLNAVIRSGGIPFINQTVTFQNRVMRFYREYCDKGK